MPTILPRRLPGWLHVLLLGLGLCLGVARTARATHLLGGEMSYVYIDDKGPATSPYRYRITLTGYYNGLWPADQSVRQPPTTVDFQLYYQTTGAAIGTFTSEQVLNFGSPVYPRVPAGCGISGPSQPFYLLRYSATVNLPFSAAGYFAVCTQRDRNLGLTNVDNPPGPNGQGATVPMTLYVSMSSPFQFNRSPVFSDTAVAVVCANDTTILLNNAVDPDGDELKYQFGTPYGTRSTTATFPPYPNPVPYFAGKGFSGTTPLGTGPGNFAIIDANTGTAKYGATTNGLYVVAVDVGEYRVINGTSTLIGTTRRDLQLVVATCPITKTPTLAVPVVGGASGSYTIEEGQLLSLPLTASQADGHPLALTLNSVLLDGSGPFNAALDGNQGMVVSGNPTGTAVKTGVGSVGGTFTFTPACGQAREAPYDVAVTVKDNGCAGKTAVAIIRITVTKPSGPTAIAGDATVCGLNTTHSYTASGGTAPSVRWRAVGGTFVGANTGQTVQVTWTALPGKVVAIGVSAQGCATDSVSKAVTLVATPALAVSGTQTICQGSSTTITVSGAGSAYTISGGPATGTGPFVLTPTATTTYTITSSQSTSGCFSTAQVTITVNPLPAATVGAATRSTCASVPLTLGAAPVAGSTYAWTPATGLSDPTSANPTLTLPNATGAAITQTYTLTETITATGCQASHAVTVTVSPAVVATPGAGLTLCSGVTGQLGAAALPGYTYSWSPATGLSSATVANPTVTLTNTTDAAISQTYTLTVTSTATGCVGTATVTVLANPAVTAVPGAAVSFCAGGSAQLGAAPVAGLAYQWTPTTGLSDPTSANPNVTLPNATTAPVTQTYTLLVTSTTTGCTSTGTVAVTVNPLPVAVPGAAVTTCSGVPVGIGGPAVAGLSYQWAPATGLSSATVANPVVTLTNTTGAAITQTYTLLVTSTTTCASTGTVTVTVNPAVTALPGSPLTLCSGVSGQLGAAPVPGYTYAWTPATGLSSATSANPTVTLTYAGSTTLVQTYTLTTTNAATGCVGTATVAVTVNPLPVPQPGAAVATCSGVPVGIGAAPVAGYTYAWAPATGLSDPTLANPVVTLTNTTGAAITQTYTLTVTNAATGCVGTGSVAVTVNPAAVAVAGPAQTVCDHGTVTLGAAALPGYKYQWTPATNLSSATVAQPVLTGVNAGTAPITQRYRVQATTAAGCVALDSVLVTINPRPVADTIVGPKSVCPTVTGIVYAVQTPRANTYHWTVANGTLTGGQGTASITVDWPTAGTGTVSVQASNALGCSSDVARVPVIINRVLQTATPTGPVSVCQAGGPFGYQTVLATGSMYSWQLFGTAQGTLVNTGNKTSITFTQPGTAKLVVTETSDPAGGICRGTSDTLVIQVKPSPSATLAIQGPARFCTGSGNQTYTLPGAASSAYVFLLNGAALAGTGGAVVVPGTTAVGTYTLTAQETNAAGCAGPVYTTTFIVDPLPGAISISGPKYVCPSGLTQAYSVPNATASSTFQWAVTGGTISSGQGTASITVAFAAGLTANASVRVTETSQFGCAGAAVALTVVPDNATAPQLYAASVLDDDNTKTLLTFRVVAPNSPNPVRILRREAGSTGPFAQVGTVPAPPDGSSVSSFQDTGLNAAQTAYEYSLDITTGCGDVLTAPVSATTILLKAVAVPGPGGRNQGSTSVSWSAYLGLPVTQYVLEQQLDGKGYTQLATLSGTTLQYSVPNTGQGFQQCYRVRAFLNSPTGAPLLATSNTTCVSFEEKTAFYNIITPNGDGLNDKLEIDNVQLYPGNTMQVFNRWGREVFSTTNYNNQSNYWGADPGIAPGVYYYLFKLSDGSSTKGWVEVVK